MPKGPHELRLDTYVVGGSVATIRHSAAVWDHGQQVLERLATALDTAKPQLMHKFGPQTGPAAVAAFEKVSKNVREQAAEMKRASAALTTAGDALQDAESTHQRLGNAPASPPADATQKAGESAEAFHQRQRDVSASQHHYAVMSAQREQESQQATHTVDAKYTHAIKVMESIHGRPARADNGGGGTGSGGVPGGSVPPPTSPGGVTPGSSWHSVTGGGDVPGGTSHVGGGPHGGTDTGGGNVDTRPPAYGDPGVPQGPGYPGPGHPVPGGTSQPVGDVPFRPGGQVPTAPSVTSPAIGSLISAGIVTGTSGFTNVMRTSAISSVTAEEQAALSASRATGTTGMTGMTGATRAAGATTGRGGAATGRSGAVGTSGSSRAGSRSGGAGTGAGGRGDRGRKKRRPTGTDFFDDNEDWLDDDEASSGVLQ